MDILEKISTITKTNTIKHFSITSMGTMINGLLGLLFFIFLARSLGPDIYGVFSVAIVSMALLSDVADLGVDTGIIHFVSKYRQQNQENALKFIKLGLEIKFSVWLIILILGWFLIPFIAQTFFLKPELTEPLRFALIGVGGALLFSLTIHAIQAYEKFWAWSFLNIGLNGFRLLAVVILFILGLGFLNLSSSLLIYIALPFLGFFITFLILPNYLNVKGEKSVGSELIHYSKWVALVGIFAATASRLDTFISARFLPMSQVGIYSAVNQLSVVVPQIVFALATVVAPKMASLDSHEKAITYFKKLQLLVLVIFIAGLLVSPLSFIIIPLIYGENYIAGILPFMILFIGQLIFLLALPAHQAVYFYFSKPALFSFIAGIQLLITGILGWFLILNYGIYGAAVTVLISNLFGFIVPFVWVIIQFRKKK